MKKKDYSEIIPDYDPEEKYKDSRTKEQKHKAYMKGAKEIRKIRLMLKGLKGWEWTKNKEYILQST